MYRCGLSHRLFIYPWSVEGGYVMAFSGLSINKSLGDFFRNMFHSNYPILYKNNIVFSSFTEKKKIVFSSLRVPLVCLVIAFGRVAGIMLCLDGEISFCWEYYFDRNRNSRNMKIHELKFLLFGCTL